MIISIFFFILTINYNILLFLLSLFKKPNMRVTESVSVCVFVLKMLLLIYGNGLSLIGSGKALLIVLGGWVLERTLKGYPRGLKKRSRAQKINIHTIKPIDLLLFRISMTPGKSCQMYFVQKVTLGYISVPLSERRSLTKINSINEIKVPC